MAELSKHADLKVYYFSDASIKGYHDKGFGAAVKWDVPLLEGYRWEFLRNYSRRKSLNNSFLDVINPGVIKALWSHRHSIVIVNGWSYCSTWLVIIFAKLLGKKVWLRAENPLNQELKKNTRLLLIKRIVLKYFLFNLFIDKCLYIGTQSKEFFKFYGVKEANLLYTPYAVDNNFFRANAKQFLQRVDVIKRELNLPLDKKVILFVGKFIPKKRPLDLIKAFELSKMADAVLVLVGEGELRDEMEQYTKRANLANVVITGFVNQSQISKYYAIADLFVMCSGVGETWGLAVNEVMNFEKFILVSKTVGCSSDLIRYGGNGFTFEEGDIAELSRLLNISLRDENLRREGGKVSYDLVSEFSIEAIVKNLLTAAARPS